MLIADINDSAAGWIYTALHDLQDRMRRDGRVAPAGVDEFAAWCLNRARKGQDGPALADLDGLAEAAAMTKLALDFTAVGALLGVSQSSVKRLVRDGHLPAVHILGSARVRTADLEAYVAGLSTEGAA